MTIRLHEYSQPRGEARGEISFIGPPDELQALAYLVHLAESDVSRLVLKEPEPVPSSFFEEAASIVTPADESGASAGFGCTSGETIKPGDYVRFKDEPSHQDFRRGNSFPQVWKVEEIKDHNGNLVAHGVDGRTNAYLDRLEVIQ